ncbi:hypothetical protein AVEN_209388-1 [Araneus ventricosus]|uniref:Uncharacterized protein n=1 Tax=Araneus ventricosus TaxID=182803 RepID=A0A4Y2FJ97_ARAVE|nr:hypothetical protein AVEN_209388-1 [Araneus ventricosus]
MKSKIFQLVHFAPVLKARFTECNPQEPMFRISGSSGPSLMHDVSSLKNLKLALGPSIDTWKSFFKFKGLVASLNAASKSSEQLRPRKAEFRYRVLTSLVAKHQNLTFKVHLLHLRNFIQGFVKSNHKVLT